ncbi:hypothetical protein [Novosphingobium barchaimii]|uniref:hypothetical protein n=1 Tax=Novosphingobium barchaimii TaxID=1420591 RepID=UPI0011DFCBF2|nr:hypothetical protein [Novosphingobium barchaimii]
MSNLLARLIEAGTPAELVGEVAMLLAEQKVLENRRANERERKAKQRAGHVEDVECHVTSRDGTGQAGTSQDNPSLPRLPNENKSNPSTPTHPEKQSPRTRKGTRLPVDWQPASLDAVTLAEIETWPAGAMERELSKFRDWAKSAPGTKGVKSDWDATWRNWLRKAHDEGRYGNGNSRTNSGPRSSGSNGRPKDGAIAALDRKMGLDRGPGEPRYHDDRSGSQDRGRAAAGPRSLF